jgi:aldehyde dehydrogenase (NAD+)
MLRTADALEKRQEDIIRTIREESGATFGITAFQFATSVGLFREAASQITFLTGEVVPVDRPGAFSMVIRKPVGVVAGISPWNAPMVLALRAIAFPIAFGNTVVTKPSAETPVSGALLIAEIFEEVGLPPGVYNTVTNAPGHSNEIGDEFIENPEVRHISLTGSTAVGKQIAEKAGKYLKKVTLELGGSDPLIVLKDADIDYAVNATVFGRFLHQGQICMSSKRIMVEKQIAEEYIAKLVTKVETLKVGDPLEQDTIIGPIINKTQLNIIKKQVDEAVKKGTKLLCGGKIEGLCYYPTVLTNIDRDMNIIKEEVFGPVAPVIVVEDAEEAIGIANESAYGLSAGIITKDMQKGLDIAEKIESGMVHINDATINDEPQVPFGGCKDSGYGKTGGRQVMDEYTELRWITIQRTPREYPF